MLLPLLEDKNPQVLQEVLVALSQMSGDVKAETLLPLLSHRLPEIRGAAALALTRHQPDVAAKALPTQLDSEVKAARSLYDRWTARGRPKLMPAEIEEVMGYYRCQMKEVQAISMLHGPAAVQALEEQAFRPGQDFSQMNGVVAAFQLWDRVGTDPRPAVRALAAADQGVADKAEWMLVQSGPSVLPAVREALSSPNKTVKERAIRIVAWQGDLDSLPPLRAMEHADSKDAELAAWAMEKIQLLHPKP
jgi:glycerophosphoryl diester phosphodiesterase